jgi:FG-GAP repeat
VLAAGAALALPSGSLVQQGKKIVPGDELGGSEFGTSVAISADGNTAVVGGIGDEVKGSMGGAAWIYARSGGVWSEQQKLDGGSEQEGEAQFGSSVAISADGNTVIVGGYGDNLDKGAAWVFTRSGSKWVQQGKKLEGGGEVGLGRFGRSVALSADGDTALIGGYYDEGVAKEPQLGAAWVFTRSAGAWKEQTKLTGAGSVGMAQFGISAALSSDGNTALIGGPLDNSMAGAAWVFARSGSTWAQQGPKLVPSDGSGEVGASVAVSADGNTALVGGPGDGTGGAAWAFTRSGSTWTQQGSKLTPSDESGTGGFGGGVALSADGNLALIGAPTDEVKPAQPTGAVWEFARSGTVWSQQGSKIRGSEIIKEAEFGVALSLAADGDTAFVGGPIDEGPKGGDSGAGWAFADPPPEAVTGAASGLGTAAATLNGMVGAGASGRSFFQLGTTTAYGVSTPVQELGRSGTPRALAAAVAGLSASTAYHYRLVVENSAGQSFGADQAFTTAASPVVCCGAALLPHGTSLPVRPVISAASQSRARWRAGRRAARFSRRRAPLGTTFHYTLNEPAAISFRFTKTVRGRKVRGRCVAQRRSNRRARACRRRVTRGSLAASAHKGRNRLLFQGVLKRGKRLHPGTYTLVMTATAQGLVSRPASLTFKIVR